MNQRGRSIRRMETARGHSKSEELCPFCAPNLHLTMQMQSEGRYTILDEIWKPRFSVSPHYHATHCETFYVVSGEVEWTVGGESHRLKAGDAVYIPPNTVHSVRVPDGKNLHTLMIYTPGGYEEHIERERAYSDKQLKDAKILDQLRRLNDFHPVVQK